ncbi:hypothetical protein AAFO90_23410, partial [Phaeobacter sp. CAU 1743]|uniref:hypothetical protein n=1 Tax=Phaeobacter sp. CAU 1743 TaxID=3140367 RepID=UPI00325C26FC
RPNRRSGGQDGAKIAGNDASTAPNCPQAATSAQPKTLFRRSSNMSEYIGAKISPETLIFRFFYFKYPQSNHFVTLPPGSQRRQRL